MWVQQIKLKLWQYYFVKKEQLLIKYASSCADGTVCGWKLRLYCIQMKLKINKNFLCTTKTKQKLTTNERQIKTIIQFVFVCLCRRMCCKECCGIWVGEWCLIKLLLVSVWGASQHPEGFGPLMLSHREPLFIHTDLGKTQQGCFRINKQVPFKKIKKWIMINLPVVRAESPVWSF